MSKTKIDEVTNKIEMLPWEPLKMFEIVFLRCFDNLKRETIEFCHPYQSLCNILL